ncbi:Ribosome-recycling factor, mitochondrial [Halotydeus destructor]|nr:Ribosome-recycling factor, mitochondrial [Halotydeus destructor]
MFNSRVVCNAVTRIAATNFNHLSQSHMLATVLSAQKCVCHCQPSRQMAKKAAAKESKKIAKPKVVLRDEELAEVINVEQFKHSLNEVYEKLKSDYVKNLNVRSGVGIEALEVEFEEEVYPLKELATISKKGSSLLVLNFTALPDAIKPAEEAILKSGMNINPQQEGTVLYLTLPKVTREHRETLAKNAKLLFNKAKDDMSKVYSAYHKAAKKKEAQGVSQDLVHNVDENIKFMVDNCVTDCEHLLESKTRELLGE